MKQHFHNSCRVIPGALGFNINNINMFNSSNARIIPGPIIFDTQRIFTKELYDHLINKTVNEELEIFMGFLDYIYDFDPE